MHVKHHMLMNAVTDGAASSGSAPAGTAAPANTPAQGNAAPGLDLDQLSKLIDSKLTEQRNGIFADLRKAGALGKAGKTDPDPQQPPVAAPQGDEAVRSLIAKERAFTRAIAGVKMSDSAFARMEKAFQLEQPEDPTAWTKGYIADLGIGHVAQDAQHTTTPAQPRSAMPVSDGGSPSAVSAPSKEAEPWTYSQDDVNALVREKGFAGAGSVLRQQLRHALNGRRIRTR